MLSGIDTVSVLFMYSIKCSRHVFLLKNKRTYLCPVKQTIKGHLLKRFAETRCRLHRKIDLFRFVKTVFISTILIKKNCQFYSYCIKKGFVKVYYDGLVK